VVSILDLIPLAVTCHRRTGLKARAVHRWAARADAFLTISEFTKGQLVRTLGIAPDRIVVAPLPPSPGFELGESETGLQSRSFDAPYSLAIADCRSPDPRKRLEWLIDVGRMLMDEGGKLVVVGAQSEQMFGASSGIEALGAVDDTALRSLMRNARVFVFPSAYEGQGLPPLEAMSLGVPVVAMDNTSLPEVVGEGGILVEEETSDWALNACRGGEHSRARARFAQTCVELFSDSPRRDRLGAKAALHAGSFDAQRFALGVRAAYELAL
jgi:glycosyltransferase involved in cell wall biosynthesis